MRFIIIYGNSIIERFKALPFAGFKTLTFLLFFLAESACVRLESYNIGVAEEHKPVIFSIISPDLDTIGVWVSKTILGNDTVPLYSKNEVLRSSLTEKDAEVYISGNNTRMRLIYNEKREQFVVSIDSFPIQKGGKYALEVKLATGEVAKSSTIIPDGECIIDDFNYAPRFERDESALLDTIYDIELKWSGTIASNAKFMLYDYSFWGFSFGSKIRRGKAVFPEKSDDGTYSYQMKTKIHGAYYDSIWMNVFIVNDLYEEYSELKYFFHEIEQLTEPFETFEGIFPVYNGNIENGYGYFGSFLKSDDMVMYLNK